MIPLFTNKSKHNHITAQLLRDDKVATQIGFWKLERKIHGKQTTFCIVEESDNRFVVAVHRSDMPIKVIAQEESLEDSALFLDNFVAAASNHDITMLLDSTKPKLVIGR